MMNIHFHHQLFLIARRVALFHVLVVLFSLARLVPQVSAAEAEAKESAAIEHASPADPGSHASVVRTGTLPPQATRSADAQFWVQFEVAVPRGYSIEVNTEAGDITTGDIGGTAALHTQGGNIKTGRIGASGPRDASWVRSAAKLDTKAGTF